MEKDFAPNPSPTYPVHILIVPKKSIQTLMDITKADQEILSDVFETAKTLVTVLNLEEAGFRLIVNGGVSQDTDHLHFHLVSGNV